LRQFFIIGFLIVLSFDTLAQVSFKLAGTYTHPELNPIWLMRVACNPWTYGAIIGYLGAFIAWMTLLKHAPIGPAFAATHLYVVTVAIVAFFFFGEKFSMLQIIGGLLIISGILILAYGKDKGEISVSSD